MSLFSLFGIILTLFGIGWVLYRFADWKGVQAVGRRVPTKREAIIAQVWMWVLMVVGLCSLAGPIIARSWNNAVEPLLIFLAAGLGLKILSRFCKRSQLTERVNKD